MVIGNRPLHAFFSGVFAVLLLASTTAAQDKPSGAPSPSGATTLSILTLSPPPFTPLRISKLFNLRMIMAAQGLVEGFLKSFKEFPPRQKAASFTIDQAVEKMQAAWAGGSAAVAKTA